MGAQFVIGCDWGNDNLIQPDTASVAAASSTINGPGTASTGAGTTAEISGCSRSLPASSSTGRDWESKSDVYRFPIVTVNMIAK
jgi:hypothetical protein